MPYEWSDEDFKSESERGQSIRSKPRQITPTLSNSQKVRNQLISALMGVRSGMESESAVRGLGDPLVSFIAGAAGAASAPSGAALNAQQEEQLRQQEMIRNLQRPLSESAPRIAEKYPMLADIPLAQAEKFIPLITNQERLEGALAREKLKLELREETRGLSPRARRALEKLNGMESGALDYLTPEEAKTVAGAAGRAESRETSEGKTRFSQEQGLAKRFEALSSEFRETRDAYTRVLAVSQDDSPAAGLALIFNFMRVQDPRSTVRESEFKSAEQARAWLTRMDAEGTAVPAFVAQTIRKFDGKSGLLPEQREDFVKQTKNIYSAKLRTQEALEEQFRQLAEDQKLDPKRVVLPQAIGVGEPDKAAVSSALREKARAEIERRRKGKK